MRLTVAPSGHLHAHNASGYGLMALISGQPYFLTVYGSEVYSATERGPLYRALLGRILRGALRISCTTIAMREFLVREMKVPADKVQCFSMGIPSRTFFFDAGERASVRADLGFQDCTVVTSNRRLQPQYRTHLIIDSFAQLYDADSRYRLVLFEGDSDPHYVARITSQIERHGLSAVAQIVPSGRSADELRRLLVASDVVVSTPTTDQMSASVLEALACGCEVVLSAIPAYDELFAKQLATAPHSMTVDALASSIAVASHARRARNAPDPIAEKWLLAHHSDPVVAAQFRRFVSGPLSDE